MAKPYKRGDSSYYWIAPMIDGVQRPQSSKTADYAEACDMLRILEGLIASGEPVTQRTGKILVNELLDDYVSNYKSQRRITNDNDRGLKDSILCRLTHLRPAFGKMKAGQVKRTHIASYVQKRQEDAENGTINRELALLKAAFRLGQPEKIITVPKIKMLPEDNERDGFFEPAEFKLVLSFCNPIAVSILTFAYITGWRIASIVDLEWRHVDLKNGFVWRPAEKTKNKLAVRWPLVMGLQELLEERRQITDETERKKGMIIPRVFHRDGKPVMSVRTAWEKARVLAHLDERKVHDFRGTATVNLLESGVDLIKVMGMVGFKSIQMVARYAGKRGLRESSLNEAGSMLEKRLKFVKPTTKT